MPGITQPRSGWSRARPKFSARGGVVKVSNYMLPVGYYMYVYKPLA